jgi:DNA polymerase-1
MGSSGKLLLIDGMALLYRTFYSIKTPLTTSSGVNVAALYGALRACIALLKRHQPERFAFVMDTPQPTFRHKEYPEYKANRPPIPPELPPQLDLLRKVIPHLGWKLVEREGYEADDLIATLTRQTVEEGGEVLIFTADKDLMQLIGPSVSHLIHGRRGEENRRGADYVREKFGVEPGQIRDLLALTGDSSDNLPGIPGVGPKKAAALLTTYGSFDGVFAHADEVKGKLGESLREHQDDARLTWKLVRLDDEAPVPPLAELAPTEPTDRAKGLLKLLGFNSLIRELGLEQKRETKLTVLGDEIPASFIQKVQRIGRVALIHRGEIKRDRSYHLTALGLAVDADEGFGLRCNGKLPGLIQELLADKGIRVLGYGLKPFLGLTGITNYDDALLAGWLVEANRSSKDLPALCEQYLGRIPAGGGGEDSQGDLLSGEGDELKTLAGEAAALVALTHKLELELATQELKRVYYDIELPLAAVLASVEKRGILLDSTALNNFSEELTRQQGELAEQIHALAGHSFNVASPKQVGEVLFGELGLPGAKKTKSGYSTSRGVLEKLVEEHEIARLILEHRQLAKLDGTYAKAFPKQVAPDTGRLHTTLHQAAVSTGRLSSSNPNLQNIPIRTELGRHIREAFIAPSGWKLISADYSQIELRLMAHIAGETRLIEGFLNNADVHRLTAGTLLGIPADEVTKEQRNQAKIVNYSLFYGKGVYGLARDLRMSIAEAKAFIDNYFSKYPAVREWMDGNAERARELGYTITLFGRKRPFGGLDSPSRQVREASERAALNAPIQGSAADLCKLAMIRAEQMFGESDLQARMLLQIHDELLVECPVEEVEATSAILREAMENAAEGFVHLSVPITVDIGSGDNWLQAH